MATSPRMTASHSGALDGNSFGLVAACFAQ